MYKYISIYIFTYIHLHTYTNINIYMSLSFIAVRFGRMSKREKEKLNAVMLQIASHSATTPRGNDQSTEDKKSPNCEDRCDEKKTPTNGLPSPKVSPSEEFTKNVSNEVDSSCSPRSAQPSVSHASVDVRQDLGVTGVMADNVTTTSRYSPPHVNKTSLIRNGNLPQLSPVSTMTTTILPSITSASVNHRVSTNHLPPNGVGMNRYPSYGNKQCMMSGVAGGDNQAVQMSGHPIPVLSGKNSMKSSLSPVHTRSNCYNQRSQVNEMPPTFATNNGHHTRNSNHDPASNGHPGTSQRALEHLLSQQSVLGHSQNYKANFMLHNGSSYDMNGSVTHADRKPPMTSVSLATLFEYQMRQAIVESNTPPSNGQQKFHHMPANCIPKSEPTNGYDKNSFPLKGPGKRSHSPANVELSRQKFCKLDKEVPTTTNCMGSEQCSGYFNGLNQPKSEILTCNSNMPACDGHDSTYTGQDPRLDGAIDQSVNGVITASRHLSSANSEPLWKPSIDGKPSSIEDSKSFLQDPFNGRHRPPSLSESDKKLISPVNSKELLQRIEMVDSLTKVYCLEMDSQRRCLEGILHVIIRQHTSGENVKVSFIPPVIQRNMLILEGVWGWG